MTATTSSPATAVPQRNGHRIVDLALARALGLPKFTTGGPVQLTRDIPVPAADGTPLFTDMHVPAGVIDPPTLLIRTPYGRGGTQGVFGRLFARYGFRVITQSSRGTAGTPGEWAPFVNEAPDAQATVVWMREQPWFTGRFATYGVSYAGYTQWSLASEPPPELAAMIVSIAPINPRSLLQQGHTFNYQTALAWTREMPIPRSRLELILKRKRGEADIREAAESLPLIDGYVAANRGRRASSFEEWMIHLDDADPYWDAFDQSQALDRVNVPVLLIAGWHDLFTAEMVSQFETLRDRGLDTRLLVAATTHSGTIRELSTTLPIALQWARDALASRPVTQPGTVFAQDVASKRWREFETWPPQDTRPYVLHLHSGGRLRAELPSEAAVERYDYDPADPTPSIGGDLFALSNDDDNRPLEARDDVLTYSLEPITQSLALAGSVSLEAWLSSSLVNVDVFARLCDVDEKGRSSTICDAIVRLKLDAPDTPQRVRLELPPTLCTIAAGHQLRLLLSGGAHPRFARNLGTDEPLATGTTLRVAENRLHTGPETPSSLSIQRR